ncbi:LacI family DNA-binding transcriptional regulator [Spongiimicrobium sp. 3-5]|uniref:LacI family DNA-binding transcriptional regulator n=1 Tax=Spongiimicrobium sp. 3-5 TaxID=3332596 RepID=UPI0039817EDA
MKSEMTIRQISQLSGFSISTISKALNDRMDVSKKTKSKIRALAKQHNYVPNNSAVALSSSRTNIIAVILPKITAGMCGYIISKIQIDAFKKGYRILVLQSFGCEKKEAECFENISNGTVDGVIVVRPSILDFVETDADNNAFCLKSGLLSTIVLKVANTTWTANRIDEILDKSLTLLLSKIDHQELQQCI